jgi:glycosyltransferase involved in cell wall biosynthesis
MEKIFIGLEDIASQIGDWRKGFNTLGYETFTASLGRKHIAQRMDVDVDISSLFKLSYRGVRPRKLQHHLQDKWHFTKNRVFKRALRECDVFVMIGSSFYNDVDDFRIIKESGKKLVCILTGEDCRWYYTMKQEFEMYGLEPIEYPGHRVNSPQRLNGQLTYLRNIEKYADVIMSLPNQAQLALRPYSRFICLIDYESLPFSGIQRVIPKIVHAPTNQEFKGTRHFLSALERLKNEGVKFEFELIENLPYPDAIKKYEDADIILNQVYCPCGGKLAYEGMALGKIVLTRMGFDKGYDEKTPEGCPIIDIGPSTVYEKLKDIIQNLPLRQELSYRGREYVEKNNSSTDAAKKVMKLLEGKDKPDFVPNFLKEHFVPESDDAAQVYNNWNAYLKNCEWYKKYVGSFSRDGLIF